MVQVPVSFVEAEMLGSVLAALYRTLVSNGEEWVS